MWPGGDLRSHGGLRYRDGGGSGRQNDRAVGSLPDRGARGDLLRADDVWVAPVRAQVLVIADDSNGGPEASVVGEAPRGDHLRAVVVIVGDGEGVADVEAHGWDVGGHVAFHHGGVLYHASVAGVCHLKR